MVTVQSETYLDGEDLDGTSSSEAHTGLADVIELLLAVDCDASRLCW